ncbi:MAG: 1-deoxy-D-xylulose-5-phosphate synthase [Planctomycetota bacterium]
MAYELLEHIHGPADLKALTEDQLPDLAQEVRQAICDQVSRSGGHLAPNLGVVELTLALHRVFDFGPPPEVAPATPEANAQARPGDRLLFDVGHQCYPHKLLTGRLPLLDKLRQKGGMSGFPSPDESPYDLFAVGHAGTAISTAVGMARADALRAQAADATPPRVVSLVGDASIVNGVALEGLNNAGTLHRQFLVVLNDNGMSIAKPQGAMASHFDRLRVSDRYAGIKNRGRRVLEHIPGGSFLHGLYHRGSEMLKALILSEHLFEHFGLICVGPVDGHDLPSLISILEEIKDIPRPVLLHVKTIKGKGFDFAEGDACAFHSPKPFQINGCRVDVQPSGRSFTSAYTDAMKALMRDDQDVFAVTAAMPDGTGLAEVMADFPERTLDTGICESHAMDMCAGMAKSGVKPFFAVYSTFAQRALDQVFQEVALQGLPVRVCMDRGGYVGGDGAVHHGFMDISMLRPLPGAVQLAAADEPTLAAALRFMADHDAGPTFLRYPRDVVAPKPVWDQAPTFELGRAALAYCTTRDCPESADAAPAPAFAKPDLAILAYGPLLYAAIDAAHALEQDGRGVAVYDARFAQPVDADLFEALARQDIALLTVEDHAVAGGFGAAVLEALHECGAPTRRLARMGHPARWVGPDSRKNQLADAGLSAQGIADRARTLLESDPVGDAAEPDGLREPIGAV